MYFTGVALALSPLWIIPVICAFPSADLPKGSEIVQCNVIYRHGDRTPVAAYPKSKFRSSSFWPDGWGQLSLKGMKQHFEFGRLLMKEYGPTGKKLVPPIYNSSDYRVFSTDYDRTIMSGLANSAGIYYLPGEGIQNDIQWKPIPIRAVPASETDQGNHKFFHLKCNIRIYSLPTYYKFKKLTFGGLPDWAQRIFPYPLQNYSMEYFKQYTATEKLKRLTAGPLLKTVINNMFRKAMGEDIAKLYSYSAHDVHVFPILDSIGLTPQERPGYTSAIIFELYKSSDKDFFVQLLYRPGPDMEAKILRMPGCDGRQFCPLSDFIKITAHLIPEDLKKECESESY